MTNQVVALLNGREVGTVHYKDSRLSFAYSEGWKDDPPAVIAQPFDGLTIICNSRYNVC